MSEHRLRIAQDPLTDSGIIELLEEHLAHMHATSPPGSVHALDLDALRSPQVTFWSVRCGDEVVGCGALTELAPDHGEIKSMRTARKWLGKGVASLMLHHIIDTARERGYQHVSLETGSGQAFEPAHSLYLKFGFAYCGPFADYKEDPFSRFMTRAL
jgi:putative acetyltransferase